MKQLYVLCLFALFLGACKSIAKYPIDDKPCILIDNSLLGAWTAAEDTDQANYILVQDYNDVFQHDEGTNSIDRKYAYYFSCMTGHGKYATYGQLESFVSKVGKSMFFNIPYRNEVINKRTGEFTGDVIRGYFFIRIIDINPSKTEMITALVADTSLVKLKSSKELRNYIAKNIDNPRFYSDTLHFRKTSNFHRSSDRNNLIKPVISIHDLDK